jgi:hypothetical protein
MFVSQTLLLAASWHRHAAADARLEVYTVGGRDAIVDGLLREIGADGEAIAPGGNDDFSPSSNKIEAAHADPGGARVLLLDNDVVFFGGVGDLATLPAGAIAAGEAGTARVTDEQWRIIAGELGMPLLRRRWAPLNTWDEAAADVDDAAHARAPEAYLYLNSGVVLFPAGHDHRDAWKSAQRRIRNHFAGHPLESVAVTSSDQAGLAASVAAHGEFSWLPLRYNYRHGAFRLGLLPADGIGIMHFTGDVPGAGLSLAQRLEAYWARYIEAKFKRLSPGLPPAEKRRRRDVADAVLAQARALVRDYDLDARLAAWRRART